MHNRQLSKKSNLNCIFGHFLTSKNHFFPFLQWMKNDNNNTVCKKRSHGGIHLNVKILVQIIISMYRAGQESGTTVSVYSHLWNTVKAPSWFGDGFQPVLLGMFSKLMELETQQNTLRYWSTMKISSGVHQQVHQQEIHFLSWHDPKLTDITVKSYLDY